MTVTLVLKATTINTLDLRPGHAIVETLLKNPKACAQQLQCVIDYPLEQGDPRELSEIPEIRLWFVRWDAAYPWLPYFLDWRAGELARYAAMLVPHQFSQREGIQYNPEALEIFVMNKIFVLMCWFKQVGLGSSEDLKAMAKVMGYDISQDFFDLVEAHP
jgi:hypothetical protein